MWMIVTMHCNAVVWSSSGEIDGGARMICRGLWMHEQYVRGIWNWFVFWSSSQFTALTSEPCCRFPFWWDLMSDCGSLTNDSFGSTWSSWTHERLSPCIGKQEIGVVLAELLEVNLNSITCHTHLTIHSWKSLLSHLGLKNVIRSVKWVLWPSGKAGLTHRAIRGSTNLNH